MGIFKKLFRRRKNEIHMSAEEAFAPESAQSAPSASEEKKPEITGFQPAGVDEEKLDLLASEEAEALGRAYYCRFEPPEDAGIALRSCLRALAGSIEESGADFCVSLSDASRVRLTRSPLPGSAGLPEKLRANLEGCPAAVKNRLDALNCFISVLPESKGNNFEGAYAEFLASLQSFLASLNAELDALMLLDGDRLVDCKGKLIWDGEGNTELSVPVAAPEASNEEAPEAENSAQAEEQSLPQQETPGQAQADVSEEETPAPEEKPSAPDREEKSRALILSHGITLDASRAVRPDSENVYPRNIKEVIDRASALTAAALIARSYALKNSASPAARSAAILERYDKLHKVKSNFSPKELSYLKDPNAGRHTVNMLQAEAAAALLWAVGLFELGWPDEAADAAKLNDIFKGNDTAFLCAAAKPRTKEELLDMYDLTTRLHAMCVRASIKELKDTGLDPDIIYERHYALNWLMGIGGFIPWDSVIPTT